MQWADMGLERWKSKSHSHWLSLPLPISCYTYRYLGTVRSRPKDSVASYGSRRYDEKEHSVKSGWKVFKIRTLSWRERAASTQILPGFRCNCPAIESLFNYGTWTHAVNSRCSVTFPSMTGDTKKQYWECTFRIYWDDILGGVFIAVKRHHDHKNFYKGKHVIGWLAISEV